MEFRVPGPVFKAALAVGTALLAGALTGPPGLAGSPRGGEVGVIVGEMGSDQDITSDSNSSDLTIGVRGGAVFTPHWGWHVDALYANVPTRAGLGDATIFSERAAADFTFFPNRRLRWFLSAGAGRMTVDYENSGAQDFDRTFVSGSVGARFEVGDLRSLRFELRADTTVNDAGLGGADVMQGYALAAYVWGPGTRGASHAAARPKASQPPPSPQPVKQPREAAPPRARTSPGPAIPPPSARDDEDGDGVKNRRDQCPGTPRGAIVDGEGCPRDEDRDGVPSGIDQCPATPRGDKVDARGCSADADRDGVPDSSDSCPATPAGAVVDEWGCPRDGDGDGVPNGLDRCAATPPGAVVDSTGCPSDTDGDGVYDGVDRCPATPKGAAVDAFGCPR